MADDSQSQRRRGFLKGFMESVFGTGLSRVLGAARDVVIAWFFGAGAVTDAFWIAFTIPNTFRRFVADEGLTGAIIPALAHATREEGEEGARRLANSTLAALLVANLGLCVVGILGAEWVVKAFAYAFTRDPEQFELAVSLTRWLFPFTALVSLVSFAEGLLNFRRHFFIPKLAPGMVSLGVVVAVLLLASHLAEPIYALVIGVLAGGVVHVLICVPPLLTRWGAVGLSFAWGSERFRRLCREMGLVIGIGIFAQVNILVLRQLAAAHGTGAVTWYWNATRLIDLAQGVIAIAIGSAMLPDVSRAVAEKDWTAFRQDVARALRLAAFLLLPVAVGVLAFALPITASLFRVGAYTMTDVTWTAKTLQLLTPFLLTVAGVNIIKRVYYAVDDRRTLLWVGAAGVALTAVLGYLFVQWWELPGLALALSASTTIQLAVYLVLLHRRLGDRVRLRGLAAPLTKMALASLPVGVVLSLIGGLGHWEDGPLSLRNLSVLLCGLGLAGVSYFGLARALGLEEFDTVVGGVLRRFRR